MEFAFFCQKNKKNMDVDVNLTSFALNADGYLNSIYLKHKKASGTVIIHRKCVALLGAKNYTSVNLLTNKAELNPPASSVYRLIVPCPSYCPTSTSTWSCTTG